MPELFQRYKYNQIYKDANYNDDDGVILMYNEYFLSVLYEL